MSASVTTKKTVDLYISELVSEKRQMAEALRRIIRTADPELRETIKWGNPTYTKNGNVCYIAQAGDHMNFGFYKGVALSNPDGIIEGTGKGLRHIKVRSMDDILPERFAGLVREAVGLNQGT